MTTTLRVPSIALLTLLAACKNDDPPANADESSSSSAGTESSSSTAPTTTVSTDDTSTAGTTTVDTSESGTVDSSSTSGGTGDAMVVLNEVTSVPVTNGPYNGAPDAIELYNAGDGAADLSGWRVTDDSTFPAGGFYTFPPATTLAPGEWLVLVGVGKNGMGELPFGISDDSEETLTLDDGTGVVIDAVVFDGYDARISWCRVPDGSGSWTWCDQTFSEANAAAATACGNDMLEEGETCDGKDLNGADCESLGLGFTGGTLVCSPACVPDASGCTTDSQVVINELESTGDDIELFNAGDDDIDISGWVITDDPVDAAYDPAVDGEELAFAAGTILGAGEYLVVPVGKMANQHPFGLGGGGDQVTLLQVDPVVIIDSVAYGDGEAASSYCRLPNGPTGTWTADCTPPTMGSENLD